MNRNSRFGTGRTARPGFAATMGLAALLAAGLAAMGPAAAAEEDADWPCAQRLVPEISAGMVWAGPPVGEAGSWQDDAEIADLASELSDRRMPLSDAEARVDKFAETLGADKDHRLTLLFAGILDKINADRSTIVNGIKRYTRRQRALAARIEEGLAELDSLPSGGTSEQQARRQDLQERNTWDSRIYEEREKSLKYLCDTPVVLEQRVFALARAIQNHLD